jgi:FtsH-binding integral membrane protein
VGIFLGLTAYDMQQIRNQLWANDSDLEDRIIVIGALSLFINYINIFVNLVQLLGNRE